MKKKRPFGKAVRAALSLPDDLDPHLVQISWVGRETVLIEQHRGIAGFESEEIRLESEQGTVVVRGRNMNLRELSQSRAFLSGEIDGIFFEAQS